MDFKLTNIESLIHEAFKVLLTFGLREQKTDEVINMKILQWTRSETKPSVQNTDRIIITNRSYYLTMTVS